MIEKIIKTGMITAMVLGLAAGAFCQIEKEKKILKVLHNEITGEISSITKNSISILYSQDKQKGIEYEAVFPLDEETKIARKKRFSDLNVSDTVTIQYEEITAEDSDLNQKTERKAKTVIFVKPAVKKIEPPGPPEPGME